MTKNIFSKILILAAALALLASPAAAGQYDLDPAHTSIGFAATHLVIAKVRGDFRNYTGHFVLDGNNQLAYAEASIDIKSIDTGIQKRDDHLRSSDFFWADKYPAMTFKSTSVKKGPGTSYTVTGDLTIRGVTKTITLEGDLLGPITDPWGGQRAGFSARATVNRHDFGLSWNNVLETGGVVVGEMIEIVLEGEGVLTK